MNIFDFANQPGIVPSFSGNLLRSTTLWGRAYAEIGNESRTDPTVAAILSKIAMKTPAFEQALVLNGLNPDADDNSRECMVVTRATWGEYVLLVADDRAEPSLKPWHLVLTPRELQVGLARWKDREASAGRDRVQRPGLLQAYRTLDQGDLSNLLAITVYFVRRPPRSRTSAPIPALKITSHSYSGWTTAGCRVRDASGREGVTSSRHFFPAGSAIGTPVTVGTLPGAVAAEDVTSDSVFIEVMSALSLTGARGVKGWLQGVTPTVGNTSEFEGATSGMATKTAVFSFDPGVASYSPSYQARVYTAPVTNPGDSGAALVETGSDHIVGFAHERTQAGALIEWSSWIWADSVFKALNVLPI